MITTEAALKIISDNIPLKSGTEKINYTLSIKRVLAEPVYSDMNFPPFNKATMDGYACRKTDLHGPLTVIEEIPAGKIPVKTINPGQCAKIMTGAEVPEGADTVIIKEEVNILGNQQIRFTGDRSSANICYVGEDVKPGDELLKTGMIIRPEHLALFAGAGKREIMVYKKPSIAIISTGSEIVEPNFVPARGQIRNSNGPQLVGQVCSLGLEADYMGIAKDVRDEIIIKIISALKDHNLIIISGGISVGDYDYVPEILKELGFELLITAISSKPGKHTIFAQKEDHYVLGLPGNPVSSFIQFEVIGKALIYKLMGHDFKQLRFSARFSGDFKRGKADRFEIIPIRINPKGEAELLPYHGSAHIQALAYADALMEIPAAVKKISKGETVYVRPL
jgi:molybdopterin molybdotransferase